MNRAQSPAAGLPDDVLVITHAGSLFAIARKDDFGWAIERVL